MKITKKAAKKLLKGWEYIMIYNQTNKNRVISKEEYIDAFFESIKEGKNFCVKCENCNKCDIE